MLQITTPAKSNFQIQIKKYELNSKGKIKMGINFSHSDAHWSYHGFHDFRKRLAAEIGINLNEMQGFGGNLSWDEITDPIVSLLNKSDLEGELSSQECASTAPRLRELISEWQEGYDKYHGLSLADGMESCALLDEVFEFC